MRTIAGTALLCVIAAAGLAACSSGRPTTGEGIAVPPEQPEAKPTELYFFSVGSAWWNEEAFMKDYGDAIRKKFPHIVPKTVSLPGTGMTVKEMDNLIASKQPLDVILSANASFQQYVKAYQLQMDIEPLVRKHNIGLQRFAPEMLDLNRNLDGGKLTGLPFRENATQMYYNKAIFDKFGVTYPPHDRWTWEQMYELAGKLTRIDSGTQYYGVRIHNTYWRRNPYSLNYIDLKTNKAIFNNDIGKKTVELYLRQYERSDPPGLTADPAKLFFEDRTLAMFMPLSAAYTAAQRFAGLDWDLAPAPYLPEKENVVLPPYADYLYVSNTSGNKDLAMQVIDYLTSEPYQLEQSQNGFVSPLNSKQIADEFGKNVELYKGKNIRAMKPEKYAPAPVYEQFNHQAGAVILPKHVNQVRDGKTDINSALRAAEEESNKYVEAQLAQGK